MGIDPKSKMIHWNVTFDLSGEKHYATVGVKGFPHTNITIPIINEKGHVDSNYLFKALFLPNQIEDPNGGKLVGLTQKIRKGYLQEKVIYDLLKMQEASNMQNLKLKDSEKTAIAAIKEESYPQHVVVYSNPFSVGIKQKVSDGYFQLVKTTEFHPYHMAWCVFNGLGKLETERHQGGDRNAKIGETPYCLPLRGNLPGYKIKPYFGSLSDKWGPLGMGDAEIYLRYMYSIMREIHPLTFKKEMVKLREWCWWNLRTIKKIMEFVPKFHEELKHIKRVPVWLGRDCYPIAFLYHSAGIPSFYIEGVSRNIKYGGKNGFSAEYIENAVSKNALRNLLFVDSGFTGSVPSKILSEVYHCANHSPMGYSQISLDKLNESNKYICSSFYLLSSGAGKWVRAYSSDKEVHPERKQFSGPMGYDHAKVYREIILRLEYMAKPYLRSVEAESGMPKMVPSGDAIKAGMLNCMMLAFAQKSLPDFCKNLNCTREDYPSFELKEEKIQKIKLSMQNMNSKDILFLMDKIKEIQQSSKSSVYAHSKKF